MRMKLNRSRQLMLVSLASLAAAGLISACGATLTVDFVYVTSSKAAGVNNYGEVDVFEVNSESGRLRPIPTSPFPSGGRNPVAEAVAPNFANLYVVNQDDNSIVQFAIGSDGKVYPQNTVNTPGVFPLAVTINGSLLYVADTYQPLPTCSPAEPCSGSVAVFPLSSSGTMQTNTPINSCGGVDYLPLSLVGASSADVLAPSGVNVLANGSALFVSAYDTTANTGYVFGFKIGSMSCPNNPKPFQSIPTLTAMTGSPWKAGIQPSAVASDPGNQYVYVTDFQGGKVYGYAVASGTLTPLSRSPFPAGDQPASMVVDSSGHYAYVANSLDNTISAYSIQSGELSTFGTYATTTEPVAVLVDPSTGHFVYAAGYLGAAVSGFQLVPGSSPNLVVTQQAPYASDAQPTAMAAIPHGGAATK
jgi:6-phosphogluconolactonase